METKLVTTIQSTSQTHSEMLNRLLSADQLERFEESHLTGEFFVYSFQKIQNEDDLLKVVDQFLRLNKSIDEKDQKGRDILMYVVKRNFIKIFDFLLELDYHCDSRDLKNQNVIFYLASKKRYPCADMEQRVLGLKIDIQIKNNKQETVIEKALRNHHKALILQLQNYQSKITVGGLQFQDVQTISKFQKKKCKFQNSAIHKCPDCKGICQKMCQAESKTIFDEEFLSDNLKIPKREREKKYRRCSEGNQIKQPTKQQLIKQINKLKQKIKKIEEKKLEKTTNPVQNVSNKLSFEIQQYYQKILDFQNNNQTFLQETYEIIRKKIWQHFNFDIDIELAGSILQNMHTQDSNINITVVLKTLMHKKSIQKDFVYQIQQFYKKLQKNQITKQVTLAQKDFLSVMNIELNNQHRNQKVEIIFKNFQKYQSVNRENQVISFVKEYPYLQPLYFIFKRMLQKQRLNDPSIGGLKSICMVYMIVAFLKKFKLTNPEIFQEKYFLTQEYIGEVFLNFLFFYSYNFNYKKHYIRISEQSDESFFLKQYPYKEKELVIVDPYQDSIVLTKIFKKSQILKSIFKFSYVQLYSLCICSSFKSTEKNSSEESTVYDGQEEFQINIRTSLKSDRSSDFRETILKKETMDEILEDVTSCNSEPKNNQEIENKYLGSIFNLSITLQLIQQI